MSSTNLSFDYNDTSNQLLSCNNCLSVFLLKTRPELIQMIPIHWLQQDHMTYDIQMLVGIVLFIICAPTNIGHLLVFATFARSRILRTASNRLLLSLLVADFLLLANCYLFILQSLLGYPVAGIYGCNFGGFLGTVAALSEIWSLSVVSLDRFRYIHYPLQYEKKITKSQANKIILFVWTTAILFSIFPLIGWSTYVYESSLMGCTFNMYTSDWNPRSYCYVLLLFCYCIPLCIIFFSYVGIIYHNSRLPARQMPTPSSSIRYQPTLLMDNQDGEANDVKNEPPLHHDIQMKRKQRRNTEDYLKDSKEQKKLSRTFFLLIFMWVIAWTPYAFIIFWIIGYDANGITPAIGLVPVFFCKLSAAANVMLYGLRVPDFKSEVKQTIQLLFLPCIWLKINSKTNSMSLASLEIYDSSRRHRSLDVEHTNNSFAPIQRTGSAPNYRRSSYV